MGSREIPRLTFQQINRCLSITKSFAAYRHDTRAPSGHEGSQPLSMSTPLNWGAMQSEKAGRLLASAEVGVSSNSHAGEQHRPSADSRRLSEDSAATDVIMLDSPAGSSPPESHETSPLASLLTYTHLQQPQRQRTSAARYHQTGQLEFSKSCLQSVWQLVTVLPM